MNRKARVAAIALLASAVAIFCVFRFRQRPTNPSKAEESTGANRNQESSHPNFRDLADAVSNPSSLVPGGIKGAVRQHQAQQQFTQAIQGMNQAISFYGQVVDQDGAPLSGARVRSSVRHWDSSAPNLGGSIPLKADSDFAGNFTFAGVTGDAIRIDDIDKAGYELESTPLSYGAISGSPQTPITFRMWSTNIHESLIAGNKSFQLIPDGRTYVINLTNGTISESGEDDLKVWVKRPSSVGRRDRYDWSCGMEIPNGGLVADQSPGGAMFRAPQEGYTPSFVYEQKVGSGWGDTTGAKRFYLSLHGGKIYGQMTIEMFCYYNKQIPGMVRLNYAINPSGSRILK
jgi:hypothetical protein